jgi:hypothetical protein
MLNVVCAQSCLSKIMYSVFSVINGVLENQISGINQFRDCSVASLAILMSLSAFFVFHSLIIDLSLGQKLI